MARRTLLGAGTSAIIVAMTSREQQTNSRKTDKWNPSRIWQNGKSSFQEAAQLKRSSAQKIMEMRFIPAEDLEIVDCKRQNENVTGQLRKCGPRKASLSVKRRDATFHEGYGSATILQRLLQRLCWILVGPCLIMIENIVWFIVYFFLSIDTCFPNDRSPVVYTCCRWTARADEGDTAVKVVFNLLPLKDFLLCTRLISDIWGVDASTNFCIGLCRM